MCINARTLRCPLTLDCGVVHVQKRRTWKNITHEHVETNDTSTTQSTSTLDKGVNYTALSTAELVPTTTKHSENEESITPQSENTTHEDVEINETSTAQPASTVSEYVEDERTSTQPSEYTSNIHMDDRKSSTAPSTTTTHHHTIINESSTQQPEFTSATSTKDNESSKIQTTDIVTPHEHEEKVPYLKTLKITNLQQLNRPPLQVIAVQLKNLQYSNQKSYIN
ncbi:hypothetical protein RF11_07686 [Thelohanellus kitauei]|uniref:Uncharacterized protein n=1 Tax=Thelohanellus kitauei TaxID=669202 RepID=A0A0C2IP53_THEKT|nr:hypothetical protein RF11_07686 [Thelohanellus kitauei]